LAKHKTNNIREYAVERQKVKVNVDLYSALSWTHL